MEKIMPNIVRFQTLMALLTLSLPIAVQSQSPSLNSQFRCHQELVDLPGHYEYGLCTVNQAISFDEEAGDPYNRRMRQGVEAAADFGDYHLAIHHFRSAIARRDTPDARRALQAALTALDALRQPVKYRRFYNEGADPGYSVWVSMTGLRSKYD